MDRSFTGAMIGLVLAEAGLRLDAAGVRPDYTYSAEMATGTFSPRYMRLWYRDPMLKLQRRAHA